MPFRPDALGESGPMVESDNIVQESAPFDRIGMVAALLELLFPICDRFLWYLKQNKANIAKSTPITNPMEIPIISPDDSPSISPFGLRCTRYSSIKAIGRPAKMANQYLKRKKPVKVYYWFPILKYSWLIQLDNRLVNIESSDAIQSMKKSIGDQGNRSTMTQRTISHYEE